MKLFASKNILHNMPYEAITVTVKQGATGTEVVDGRNVLKAGALLVGDSGSIFDDRELLVTTTDGVADEEGSASVDGILLNDVDVTDKDAVAAMVYRGTVREELVNGGEVSDGVKEALHLIKFVNNQ